MSTSNPATGRAARRAKKRNFVLLILAVALMGGLTWAYVRGTQADRRPLNPKSSAEGVLTQLYDLENGRVQARAAAILDYPMEDVWKVVKDYDRYPEIFPRVRSLKAEKEADGRHRLTGAVATPLGDWAFATRAREEEFRDDCQVVWDEAGGDFGVNRGTWSLLRYGDEGTLVICALEAEVAPYPTFVVRNLLLNGLGSTVAALGERVKARKAAGEP